MDESKKTRLILLAVSGVLMGAAWYGYTWYQDQKAAQAEEEANVPVVSVRRKPAAQIAQTTPVGVSTPKVDALPPPPIETKPGETASAVGGAKTPGTTAVATKPGAETPPVVAQLPPVIAPPVVPPAVKTPPAVQIPVKVKPVAAQPPVQQPAAVKPPVQQPVAVKPPVQQPVAAKPPVQAAPAVAQKPAATTPPAAKPAVPSAITAVRPQPTVTTTAPVPPVATTTPAPTAAPAANATAAPPAGTTPNTTAAAQGTPSKEMYLATTMDDATKAAAANKGSSNPTARVMHYNPWPSSHGTMLATSGKTTADAIAALVPPPPEPAAAPKPKKINEKLVPPPPPEATGAGAAGLAGLPIDQLPVPPSRPTIGDKMKVLGVFDDRAIISFPKQLAAKNKWPKTITLGTGEQFESLTIVSINRDGVTIEEDGERTMKPIGTVK